MKRFAIFALLGPLLAYVIFVMMEGLYPQMSPGLLLTFLPFAYILALLPACGAAGVDWYFSTRLPRLQRIAATSAVSFAGLAVIGILVNKTPGVPVSYHLMMGMLGAVPAAVCSLLSGSEG
jgi:peptidoglycan/LPS O-acetylase OafA/YrhL